MEREFTKHYSNGEITIVWKPYMCHHSGICFKGLPEVFDPRRRPWIEQHSGATEKIVEQVMQCPSRALSFIYNTDGK